MYTKVFQNMGYILCTSCIHFGYINSDLQKVHIVKTMYTICVQNTYKMYINNYIKCILQFNLTWWVVHFVAR